jgi:hypothetical protein
MSTITNEACAIAVKASELWWPPIDESVGLPYENPDAEENGKRAEDTQ